MDRLKNPITRCSIYCAVAFLTIIYTDGMSGHFSAWTIVLALINAGNNFFAFLADSTKTPETQTVTARLESSEIQVGVTPPAPQKNEGAT